MAIAESNVRMYIQQWFKTAGLDVNIDYAWHVDRLRAGCRQCHTVEVLPIPESPDKIDWTLQDYVRRHRPGGPHCRDENAEALKKERERLASLVPIPGTKKAAKPLITTGRRFR
jgi:hypothetical protein